MMIATFALALALGTAAQAPVLLQRTSKMGEKLSYSVRSFLQLETREIGLETFLPETVDIDYDFTIEAVKEKADGIFDFRYKRPLMTVTDGETVDRGPKKSVEKSNWDLMITVSPINEFLEMKDLSKKPDKPKTGGGGIRLLHSLGKGQDPVLGGFLENFVSEVQRLALFIGSIDTAIDFQPKLNFTEVSVGDTWKRTATYSPQKLKSKNDKSVMQRLDYVYTYGGLVDSNGQKVHRITAVLEMNTDLIQFIKDNFETESSKLGFKELTFKMKAKIDYDLDAKTGHTLRAVANSDGGFRVVLSQYPEDPYVEQKLKGTTKLTLLSKK